MDTNKIVQYTLEKEKNSANIFSSNKPRDALAGTSSCVKNIGKGVLGGLCCIVAMPAIGAKENGVKGFFGGLGMGIAGCILLPIAGVATGATQLFKGLINTPEAIESKYNGKIWDKEKREWIFYNLKDETELILNQTEEDFLSKLENKTLYNNIVINEDESEKVNDTEFYDILEIETSADNLTIKNAYKKLAMKWHPDKSASKSDSEKAEAEVKFKQIGEAYQVLGDPELKRKYDKSGKEGIDKKNIMDCSQLYMFLFGSEELEFYVGELYLSMVMGLESNVPYELISFKQKKREVVIANNLLKLLEKYLNSNVIENNINLEMFYKETKNNITKTPYSKMVVSLLGIIYLESAQNYLGILSSIINSFSESKRGIENKYKIATSIYNMTKKKENENQAENGIDMIINITNMDIETTVKNSIFKILNDSGVENEERVKRAEGLVFIGKIFGSEFASEKVSKQFLINKIQNN